MSRRWGKGSASVAALATGIALASLAPPAASAVQAAAAADALTVADRVDATYQTNGRVNAVLAIGDRVYLGGAFTSVRPAGAASGVATVPRNHVAAFSRTSGALLPWDPSTNKPVWSLAASESGDRVYLGGVFSRVHGVLHHRLAAVDAITGQPQSWSPNVNGMVNAITVSGGSVFIGGSFTAVDGVPRARLAAFDASGQLDSSWQPAADSRVRVITATDGQQSLLVGGDFTTIDGRSQRHLARLRVADGGTQSWSGHPGYPVHAIAVSGSDTFVAGDGAGGHLASFDSSSGALLWTVQTDGGVQAVTVLNDVVYAGGHFDNVCVGVVNGPTSGFNCPQNAATRHKLFAVSRDGEQLSWNPAANSSLGVLALATSGTSILVGGTFTKIGNAGAAGWPRQRQQGYAQFSSS